MRQGSSVFGRLVLLIALVLWGSGGCTQAPGKGTGLTGEPEVLSAFYGDLFLEAGLSKWRAEAAPDVGVGREGLFRLVNGAADSYWERGVIRASFQEFSSEGGSEVLEIHEFCFRGSADAVRFFERSCREEGGAISEEGDDPICLVPGGSMNRALVRKEAEVFDLALYGTPASDPIGGLLKAFGRVRPPPAPAE
jgi:hypothetical protein